MLHGCVYNGIYKDFNNISVSDPYCKTGIEIAHIKHLVLVRK